MSNFEYIFIKTKRNYKLKGLFIMTTSSISGLASFIFLTAFIFHSVDMQCGIWHHDWRRELWNSARLYSYEIRCLIDIFTLSIKCSRRLRSEYSWGQWTKGSLHDTLKTVCWQCKQYGKKHYQIEIIPRHWEKS